MATDSWVERLERLNSLSLVLRYVHACWLGCVIGVVATGCASAEKMESLRKERDEARALAEELRLARDQLAGDLEALASEDAAAARVADLRRKIKEVESVNAETRRSLAAAVDTNQQLTARAASIETEVRSKNLELLQSTDELDKCQAALSELQRRVAKGKAYSGVGGGHWVSKKVGRGEFILLEDGSLWEISSIDRIDTTLWLTTESIMVLDNPTGFMPYNLINTDTGDRVEAKYIGQQ